MAITRSNIMLGDKIERLRVRKKMSRMQLGRKINQNEQQIVKYESGFSLIPLAILERIACALDDPIAKKIIRKISAFRKLEIKNKTEMTEELIDLYNQALPEDT